MLNDFIVSAKNTMNIILEWLLTAMKVKKLKEKISCRECGREPKGRMKLCECCWTKYNLSGLKRKQRLSRRYLKRFIVGICPGCSEDVKNTKDGNAVFACSHCGVEYEI